MATSRKNEDRFLDKDERDLVGEARHPNLTALDDDGLRKLATLLRERRDRAQQLDRRHRRSSRAGASEKVAESGNRRKVALLQSAIARLNKEFARRAEA